MPHSTSPVAKRRVVNGHVLPDKALPVTLLSGFLGSGKTTLLQHILRSDHGLRIAVIVNDIGAINVDASLIQHRVTKTDEKVVALQNGCICCTLRGDLLEELVRLAEDHAFDYVVIESSGISEPEQVAETFDNRLADQMRLVLEEAEDLDEGTVRTLERISSAGGIEKFAKLDTCVTVIDAFTMFNDFHTDQLLSARRDDVTPEDERTVSDLMVDQIEFADVILLNKMDMVPPSARRSVLGLVKQLNHRARILETTHARVDVRQIVNTGLFDMDRAQTGYGWLQDLHDMTVREVNGRPRATPKPETEEYGVRSFVYSRGRPFHPRRLWGLVYDKFILQLEHPDEEEMDVDEEGDEEEEEEEEEDDDAMSEGDDMFTPSNEAILAAKKASPLWRTLFRSKGEFLLATRPDRAGEWSQAGAMLTLKGGRAWFAVLPEEEYTTGDAEVDALVRHDIRKGGEWGDRHQEMVFIGEALDCEGIAAALDGCLLTDEEFKAWEGVMRAFPEEGEGRSEAMEGLFEDHFPEWPALEGHEGHEH